MQVDTLFTVSCSGCSEHEIHLLKHQIKILQRKTRLNWVYATQTRSSTADLKIQRQAGQEIAIATFGSGSTLQRFKLGWPLRVQGFLALLERCENSVLMELDAIPLNKAIIEQLDVMKGATQFIHQGSLVRFLPEQDCIQSNLVSFELLLGLLKESPKPLTKVPNSALIDTALQRYSMKKVLWALALETKLTPSSTWFEPKAEFQIEAWPLLSEWRTSSSIMRLAALFSRQFCSLDKARRFADVSVEQVASFLHACHCAGIEVNKRLIDATPNQTSQAPINDGENKGFLARLRDRLGLGFSKVYTR